MSETQDEKSKKSRKRDISDAVQGGTKLSLIYAGAVPMEGDAAPDDDLGTLERPNPDHPARHKIREGMALTPKGEAKGTLANLLIMLAEDPQFAELRSSAMGGRPYLGKDEGQLDDLIAKVAVFAQRAYGLGAGGQAIGSAITAVASQRRFYPPRDWLMSLEPWDGVERLQRAPWDLMGAESENGVIGIYFRRWMIGAVARMMRPGCKMENVIVLQGLQGARKTSMVEALFSNEWTISNLPDGKDGEMQVALAWAIELGEMVVFNRRQVNELKEWFSRAKDTFRRPFAADVTQTPRHCVFVGSTNAKGILTDPTGSRRYWVIPVGKVDLEGIKAARRQLFAEALQLYSAGEQWWLTEQEDAWREEDAVEWVPEHPWAPLVEEWLWDVVRDRSAARKEAIGAGEWIHFRLVDVMLHAVKIPTERTGDHRQIQIMEGVLKGLKAESRAKTPVEQRTAYALPEKTWRWRVPLL